MAKWLESRLLWGILLMLGGLLLLAQNLFQGALSEYPLINFFWFLLIALASIFFFSLYFQNRGNWWALIPGISFLGISLVVLLSFLQSPLVAYGGSIVLAGIGVSFLIVYLVNRENWWAFIPFGVMLTLALVVGIAQIVPAELIGGVFFIGLGLTFVLVALVPTSQGPMRWAWLPAGVLLILGVILMTTSQDMIPYLWAIILMGVGIFLILRTLLSRSG